jgi:hypothetical protein
MDEAFEAPALCCHGEGLEVNVDARRGCVSIDVSIQSQDQ